MRGTWRMRGPCLSSLKTILTKDYVRPFSKSRTYRKALKTGRGKTLALQNVQSSWYKLEIQWRMTRFFNTMMAKDPRVSLHDLRLFATGPGPTSDLAPLLGECAAFTLHLLRTDSSCPL